MKSRIASEKGGGYIEIDGKLFLPAAFRSFRPTPANVSLFYRCGVKLFQMQCSGRYSTLGLPYSNYGGAWVGDHRYDFSALDRQMKMFMRYAPGCFYMVMIQLDMPDWWKSAHNCGYDSYDHIGEACFVEEWVSDACDYLRAIIEYTEENYGGCVFAYSFSAGSATEWFDSPLENASPAKLAAYRKFCGNADAQAPSLADYTDASLPSLVGSEENIYQYMKFCAGLTPNLIIRFAAAAQSVLKHNKIVGLFFGYTDTPVRWQNRTATNGYEAVWRCPDIDMLFSPASYGNSRLIDGVSSYQYTVDSIAHNGKLYLHEIDHRTYLADYPADNFARMYDVCDSEFDTVMVLRRELCATAAKGGALWWFDFMGGYYASPLLENEIKLQLAILGRLYEKPRKSVSEIAVFCDPMSFLHMKDETTMTIDCVRHNRDSLHECGAPYDYYNLGDITKLDTERYKMYVFLNALEITDEVKTFIRERLGGKLKVWIYAPNLYSGGIEEITGIKPVEVKDALLRLDYKGIKFGFTAPTQPLFAPDITRVGDNVLIPCGNVPALLWRDLAESAGVHLYCKVGGAFYADSRFVARQTVNETDIEIKMPRDCRFEELFEGGIYETKDKILRYTAAAGTTRLFMIEDE